MQELGLSHQYLNHAVLCTNIKMTSALSFVPIADITQAFEGLSNHAGVEEQAVLDYFEANYIGELRRGEFLEPRYPHTLRNMNLRVHENLPRANNDLEGWHNPFSSSFTHRRTHVWKFIDGLKQDSSLNRLLMAQMIADAPNPPQRRIYREVNGHDRHQNVTSSTF